jgi:hypothetical protein
LSSRIQTTANGVRIQGKGNLYMLTVGGNVNQYNHYRRQYMVPQKAKDRTTIRSSNSSPRDIPEGM